MSTNSAERTEQATGPAISVAVSVVQASTNVASRQHRRSDVSLLRGADSPTATEEKGTTTRLKKASVIPSHLSGTECEINDRTVMQATVERVEAHAGRIGSRSCKLIAKNAPYQGDDLAKLLVRVHPDGMETSEIALYYGSSRQSVEALLYKVYAKIGRTRAGRAWIRDVIESRPEMRAEVYGGSAIAKLLVTVGVDESDGDE